MIHARDDYNRIQDPATENPSLLSEGSTAIAFDEPVFLVRASDQAFSDTVEAWIESHRKAGGDPAMALSAALQIDDAIAWQKKNQLKIADAPASVLKIGPEETKSQPI